MASSGPLRLHPAPGQTARDERESIRALLLERRPELDRRIAVGPSGALVIPLRGGGSIEIGRMRRRGAVRWVVVSPAREGAEVREPRTLRGLARAALGALDRAGGG